MGWYYPSHPEQIQLALAEGYAPGGALEITFVLDSDYRLSGVTKDASGMPASRTVIAELEDINVCVGVTQSDEMTGSWSLGSLNPRAHRVIGRGEPDKKDLIVSGVLPVLPS